MYPGRSNLNPTQQCVSRWRLAGSSQLNCRIYVLKECRATYSFPIRSTPGRQAAPTLVRVHHHIDWPSRHHTSIIISKNSVDSSSHRKTLARTAYVRTCAPANPPRLSQQQQQRISGCVPQSRLYALMLSPFLASSSIFSRMSLVFFCFLGCHHGKASASVGPATDVRRCLLTQQKPERLQKFKQQGGGGGGDEAPHLPPAAASTCPGAAPSIATSKAPAQPPRPPHPRSPARPLG